MKCRWCKGPIPNGKRRDAKTCSKECRQAAHRFRVHGGGPVAGCSSTCRAPLEDASQAPGCIRRGEQLDGGAP